MRRIAGLKALLTIPAVVLVAVTLVALPAFGQTTTGQVRGTVTDSQGPIPGVTVTAVNTASGTRSSAAVAANGTYVLVVPAGRYEVAVATGAHEPWKKAIQVGVGQSLTQDIALKPGKLAAEVSVVATSAEAQVERITSEIGTNVGTDQLQMLPQSSRNFLNAAVIAPGVRISRDEERQEFSYGAQRSMNTNVFIDGTSYKNDILQGGSVGQDSSKGNPFPQNAVQEFKVITQNFKAEYQKASSAVITAVTKSGGNDLRGEVFAYYQNKSLVAIDGVTQRKADQGGYEAVKPEYTRWQPGLSLGGPIVKDKVHFFAAYEGNSQDRENEVRPDTWGAWSPAFRQGFTQYQGLYPSEFRSTLLFGKLSATLNDSSNVDVSGDYRHETDIRGFGGATSYQAAENVKNDVWTVRGKHTIILGNVLNEATVSYQNYKWNPVPQDSSIYGQNYEGLMRIGSKDSQQNFTQKRFAFRDDATLLNLQWAGEHVVKAGVAVDFMDYTAIKEINVNPLYSYRADLYVSTPGDMPYRANLGFGDPDLSASNTQFGIYLQDDWRFSSRVTANIGLRWDYETDMYNNDYVTPDAIVAGFGPLYPANYFTDGTDRPAYTGMIQPRLGLSWDVTGEGKTVVHGGWGIYADRTLFNDMLDEKYRTQWNTSEIWFSKDGSPQDGRPALKWNPAYYDPAVLRQLVAQGIAGQPEAYLFNNDNLEPPSSNQWSIGIRQNFGLFNASVAYTDVHSENQLTWTCAVKKAGQTECDWGARQVPGFAIANLSRTKESWFQSFQVVVEKPYKNGWSASLSYVNGKAEQTGNDFYSANALDPAYGFKQRSNLAQDHQITLSALADLPWGFRLSTLVTTGSGFPFEVTDCSAGWTTCTLYVGGGDPPKWTQSVDFRLEKRFVLGGPYSVNVFAEVLNISNYTNEKNYEGFKPALPDVNANFGKANSGYNPQRLQFGASFAF
ncbi:MAG: TonB-dependent receptor [Holophagales bacterium]|nr:TonB-dependent receptor [Holophagales bacterium]